MGGGVYFWTKCAQSRLCKHVSLTLFRGITFSIVFVESVPSISHLSGTMEKSPNNAKHAAHDPTFQLSSFPLKVISVQFSLICLLWHRYRADETSWIRPRLDSFWCGSSLICQSKPSFEVYDEDVDWLDVRTPSCRTSWGFDVSASHPSRTPKGISTVVSVWPQQKFLHNHRCPP